MKLHNNFSQLGLGTSRLASLGSRITQKDADALFMQALESGVQVVDTADTYGSGDAERMIANAIRGKRNEFFIMTKAGFPYMAMPGMLSPLNQVGKKVYQKLQFKKNYSNKYLVSSLHKSLKRLRTDAVEAFLLHEPTKDELVSYDDFWEALTYIKKQGMAHSVGISTNDHDAFKLAQEAGILDIVQTTLPFNTHGATDVFDSCKQHDIPVVANQIMRGRVTFKSNLSLIEKLKNNGFSEKDIPALLIAYAVYIKKADNILIGTSNINHLKTNAQVLANANYMSSIFDDIAKMKV